tara:strand:- start:378 stop:2459 length:2082 start_codon:yes stop_codon:yes gene_type:complete
MAQNLGIGVSVFLRDMFSAPAARVNTSMRNLHRNAMRMNKSTLQSIQAQSMAIAGIGALALRGMGAAVRVGAEFGDTMAYVGSISDKSSGSMERLTDRALQLGRQTMFTGRDIASGMQYMAMTGMGRNTIYQNIEAATDLAGATMSKLGGKGGAADILTNVMKMFDLTSEKSRKTADILTTITSSSNTNLYDLGEAIAYSGDTMKGLNIGLAETTAMIGVMGDAGIKGSMGGTALGNMFRFMTKAIGEFRTTRQSKAMKLLGLNPKDFMTAKGELKDIASIFKLLKEAAAKKTTVQSQSMMEAIFGIRGKRSSTQLISKLDRYEQLLAKIKSGQMTAGEIMNKRMNTLQGNILKMSSAWEVLKIQFTETIKPLLIPALKVITAIVSGITSFLQIPVIGSFFAKFAVGFVLVKTAAAAFRLIISTFALIHNRNSVAFASRVKSTVAGYAAMSAAARSNAAAAATSGAANSMPLYGQTGRFGSTRGAYFNRAGALIASGTGMRRRGTALSMKPGGLGSRYMRMHGGRFGMNVAGQASRRGIMGSIGRGAARMGGMRLAGGILGRLAGVLMGPIGMAVMVGIPLISSLVGAMNGNKDATEDLTASNKYSDEVSNRLHRYIIHGKGITDRMGYTGDNFIASQSEYRKALEISRTMSTATLQGPSAQTPVNVYVDGLKTQIQKETEEIIRANLEYHSL